MSESMFYCGVSNYNSIDWSTISRQKLDCLDNDPTEAWPYGWSNLNGIYFNWNMRTAIDMASQSDNKFCNYIIGKLDIMLAEIDAKHLIML